MSTDCKNITKRNYKVITRTGDLRLPGMILLVILAIFASGCGSRADSEGEPTPDKNFPVAEMIGRADEIFKQREDPKKVAEAIEVLKQVRQADRKNYEAAWKLSRLYFYLGKYSKNEKEAEQAHKDGIEMGKVATRIEAEKPDGYFWLGSNIGEKAKRNPVTGLAAIRDIKEAMNKVIAIEPGYAGASAYDVLAQIELQTDVLAGGSATRAVEYLEKAISLEKNNSNLYLHLGEAYLSVDRSAEGKKQLETVLKMEPDPDHLFEHREAVEEAKKVLQNRF
ncbi:MAG TPA: TRAP transporter TatT component family protein [Pyrinomonadaceae bacterium]|jgi:Tfp pilus assembly protein PilF|nr:TRAP transporter TatT component family protein [Pyrinomonadaceae bacterium]